MYAHSSIVRKYRIEVNRVSEWTAAEAESFEAWANSWSGRAWILWCDLKRKVTKLSAKSNEA